MIDEREIRLRCIEAAAKNPTPHKDGFAAGVLESAAAWNAWVISDEKARATLGLPGKSKSS
jgi:hypothetical protein